MLEFELLTIRIQLQLSRTRSTTEQDKSLYTSRSRREGKKLCCANYKLSSDKTMKARTGSAAAAAAGATAMKQHPATTSHLFALLSLALLLLRLLLRLRLAAVRDAALTLHLLARLRIRPITVRLPGPDATTLRFWCPASSSTKPPLLLLHGFGGDAKWTWAHNFAALSRS